MPLERRGLRSPPDPAAILGLRSCLTLPAFKRYVLEQRGVAMAAYMSTYLTAEEVAHWVDESEGYVLRP